MDNPLSNYWLSYYITVMIILANFWLEKSMTQEYSAFFFCFSSYNIDISSVKKEETCSKTGVCVLLGKYEVHKWTKWDFCGGCQVRRWKKVSSTRAPTCLVKLLSCQKCSRRAAAARQEHLHDLVFWRIFWKQFFFRSSSLIDAWWLVIPYL